MSLLTTLYKMNTTRNVSTFDRIIRAVPTPLVAYFVYTGVLSGVLAWTLGILAVMFLMTSLSGSCSIYYFLGISTCPITGKAKGQHQ